ncbi:MAG: YggS family pyridoxal phosphate-dependent enzyme [Proteobacteria bacterium]|nr:YggS family pyridoxal phosphate-dependent enzyme [Pseudomonadota bacterium]
MLGFFLQKMSKIKNNIKDIYNRLLKQSACNLDIKLLVVSKSQSVKNIEEAYDAGQRLFGENYLQEALEKIQQINKPKIEWHFIGPIQSNKCKLIAENFSWVQSIDRIKVASRINEYRESMPPINVCIQINISNELSKSGVQPHNLKAFINEMKSFRNLKLRGIMSIPSNTNNPDKLSEEFMELRKLYEEIKFSDPDIDTLSMGMSNDYLIAVKYGATLIRVGSGIFGSRELI